MRFSGRPCLLVIVAAVDHRPHAAPSSSIGLDDLRSFLLRHALHRQDRAPSAKRLLERSKSMPADQLVHCVVAQTGASCRSNWRSTTDSSVSLTMTRCSASV